MNALLTIKRFTGDLIGINKLKRSLMLHDERLVKLENAITQNHANTVERRLNCKDSSTARKEIAENFISGSGIEVGAFIYPLPVPPGTNVTYVDKFSLEEVKKQFSGFGMSLDEFGINENCIVKPDILDDGEELRKIGDNSQDFLIANHVLEHFEDPIKSFKNMIRVVKHHGIIYIALPDMRKCFDRNREPTSLQHIIRDYEEGPEWSRELAYKEYSEIFVEEGMDKGVIKKAYGEKRKAQILQEANKFMAIDYKVHFHAWTMDTMLEMFSMIKNRYSLSFELKLAFQNHDEVIFVFEKTVPHVNVPQAEESSIT